MVPTLRVSACGLALALDELIGSRLLRTAVAIAQTGNVGLIYGSVGVLVFLVAFAFWFTPLGHAERYVPEAEAAKGS